MHGAFIEERACRIASSNGIDVYFVRADKFKTNSIHLFFLDAISNEHASKNALLPAVLRRGCERFPTFREIALYLEELYGASFDCGVVKKGEQQVVYFYMEFVSDRYAGIEAGLFEKAFNLLFEIITNPVLENGAFKSDYMEQEKENLKNLIESRVNDKVQYAAERCFEEMCREEPFGIYEYGSVEDVEKIDGEALYAHYGKFLRTFPLKVFVCGNVEHGKLEWMTRKLSAISRENGKECRTGGVMVAIQEIKRVTERMSINQGKLSLGFRTYTPPGQEGYYSLLVYNSILGGGAHSKLFRNVREKASLAYYIFSRLEKFKGLMLVSCGIESENKEKTVEIILRELEEIKAGNITEAEFSSAVRTIETGIMSLRDSLVQMADFYLSQALAGTDDDFGMLLEKVRKVRKEDVVGIAERIKLDTVYFLTGKT